MLLDYSVFNSRVDLVVDYKPGFVDLIIRIGTKGTEIKMRLSEKEFQAIFEKLQKAYDKSKR